MGVAIGASVVAIFFYVRTIRTMFFSPPAADSEVAVVQPSVLTVGTIGVCLAATVVLGVYPGPVFDWVGNAGDFIR